MTGEIQMQRTTSVASIWSLVLGILSLVCLGCIAGVPAVICGHVALNHIKHSAGLLTGDGMAIAGLIMGYLSLASMIVVIPLLVAIAIPSFVKARDEAQKATCRDQMRRVEAAVQQWATAEDKPDGTIVTEADLAPYLKDSQMPVCPKQGVYTIEKVGDEASCSVHGPGLDLSDLSDQSDNGQSDN